MAIDFIVLAINQLTAISDQSIQQLDKPGCLNLVIDFYMIAPLGKLIKEVYLPYQERLNISISEKGIFFITVESANTRLTRKVIVID
ncbi:MAG: T9SS type A sorting domain-containing protein [candidate division WOR-3 bacterium]